MDSSAGSTRSTGGDSVSIDFFEPNHFLKMLLDDVGTVVGSGAEASAYGSTSFAKQPGEKHNANEAISNAEAARVMGIARM